MHRATIFMCEFYLVCKLCELSAGHGHVIKLLLTDLVPSMQTCHEKVCPLVHVGTRLS